jgi:putative FmdB family regulatory protein
VEEWVPTYQYRCEKCGKTFERIESMPEQENANPKCPKCDSKK